MMTAHQESELVNYNFGSEYILPQTVEELPNADQACRNW